MKRLSIALLIVLTTFSISVEIKAQKSPFRLTINAKGFKDSTAAFIIHPQRQQYKGPHGIVKKEKVILEGNVPATDMYLLVFSDGNEANNKYYNAFLSNEEAEIELNKEGNEVKVNKGNTLKAFSEMIATFKSDFDALNNLNQQKQGGSVKSSEQIEKEIETAKSSLKQKIPAYLKSNGTNAVAPFFLYIIKPLLSLDEMSEYLKAVSPQQLQSSNYAMELKEYVETEKATAEGQMAPLFTQNDPDGKPVSLNDFKGKYTLIDFWASWCGPCRMENPNVVKAYNEFKDKNFTVLGVSLDRDKSKWLKAINDDNLTWTHVSDLKFWQNEVAQLYKVQSIPQNFLIDPAGKIIAKNLRGGVLHSYLQQTLK